MSPDLNSRPEYAQKVSAVIVTYHNAATIEGSIQTLLSEVLIDRIYIVDNNSTDETLPLLYRLQEKNPRRIKIIANEMNRYYANAVNQGFNLCQSQYILLTGPDVCLKAGAVHALLTTLQTTPDAGLAAPMLQNPTGEILPSCRNLPRWRDVLLELSGLTRVFPKLFVSAWKNLEMDYNQINEVQQPEASCLLIRGRALHQVGLMDPEFPLFFNDVDWCYRFHQAGWKIIYTPYAGAVHVKGGSIYPFRASSIWKSHQGFHRYFLKYHRKPRVLHWLFAFLLIATAFFRWAAVLLIPSKSHRI